MLAAAPAPTSRALNPAAAASPAVPAIGWGVTNQIKYLPSVTCDAQAASSAAAMRAHDAMVAAGVTGHAKLYNALVKAHLYEAEIAASAQGVPQGGPGRSGPLLSSTWDPRQVGTCGVGQYCCVNPMSVQNVSHAASWCASPCQFPLFVHHKA